MIHNRNMFGVTSENRVCAFCKLDHRVYSKKEVSLLDAILLMGVAGLMTFAIWGGPDLRSLFIFTTLAFILQVFLRLRYRESVKCPHCGFDPILYLQSSERAAMKVKDFLATRKDNPQFMLKPQPQIKPIYRSKAEIEAATEATMILPENQQNPPRIGTPL